MPRTSSSSSGVEASIAGTKRVAARSPATWSAAGMPMRSADLGIPSLERVGDPAAQHLAMRTAAVAARPGDVDDQVGGDGHARMVPAGVVMAGVKSAGHGTRPAPRHPLRARRDRAEDAAKPLLPGAPLHGLRRREAVVAGRPPRGQGRGRLGGGLHRVLHRLARRRRDAVHLGADVGRPRPRPSRARARRRPTGTGRWPASSSRTPARTARTARRGFRRRLPRRSRATSRTSRRSGWRAGTSTGSCPTG